MFLVKKINIPFVLIAPLLLFLSSCSRPPEKATVRAQMDELVQEYLKAQQMVLKEKNPTHQTFRIGTNKIFIISAGVPRMTPSDIPSAPYSKIRFSNCYDAAIYEYSAEAPVVGPILKNSATGNYNASIKMRVLLRETLLIGVEGFKMECLTPDTWEALPVAKKKQFIADKLRKLPSNQLDYQYILHTLKSPSNTILDNAVVPITWNPREKKWYSSLDLNYKKAAGRVPEIKLDGSYMKLFSSYARKENLNTEGHICFPKNDLPYRKLLQEKKVYFRKQWVEQDTVVQTNQSEEQYSLYSFNKNSKEDLVNLINRYPKALNRETLTENVLSILRKELEYYAEQKDLEAINGLLADLDRPEYRFLAKTDFKQQALREKQNLQKILDEELGKIQQLTESYESLLSDLNALSRLPGTYSLWKRIFRNPLVKKTPKLHALLEEFYILHVFCGNDQELKKCYIENPIAKELQISCPYCRGGNTRCSVCLGTGDCVSCHGRGYYILNSAIGPSKKVCRDCRDGVCRNCRGTGKFACKKCWDKGKAYDQKRAREKLLRNIKHLRRVLEERLELVKSLQRGNGSRRPLPAFQMPLRY